MRTILQVVVSCRGGLALAEEAADGDSMLATLYAVAEVGSSNMVVANFERSLSELKGSSANVSKSGYYPEPGTASVELLFSEGSKLRADYDYWRMLKKGNAGLSSFDHDQQYGLPARIDAFHQLEQELQGNESQMLCSTPERAISYSALRATWNSEEVDRLVVSNSRVKEPSVTIRQRFT